MKCPKLRCLAPHLHTPFAGRGQAFGANRQLGTLRRTLHGSHSCPPCDIDISGWNVAVVTSMGNLFAYKPAFNQDIFGQQHVRDVLYCGCVQPEHRRLDHGVGQRLGQHPNRLLLDRRGARSLNADERLLLHEKERIRILGRESAHGRPRRRQAARTTLKAGSEITMKS